MTLASYKSTWHGRRAWWQRRRIRSCLGIGILEESWNFSQMVILDSYMDDFLRLYQWHSIPVCETIKIYNNYFLSFAATSGSNISWKKFINCIFQTPRQMGNFSINFSVCSTNKKLEFGGTLRSDYEFVINHGHCLLSPPLYKKFKTCLVDAPKQRLTGHPR